MAFSIRLALVAATLAAAAGAAEPQPQDFVALFKAANQAHGAKDYERMERLLRDALAQRPAHPAALYNLAAARALRGNEDGALDALETLARMGLSFDPADDPDFAALREARGFRSLARDFARNARAVGRADVTFRLPMPTFIPEGLAYDDDRDEWFIGSVHERRIVRVDEDGRHEPFSQPGESWAVLGLAVDSSKRLLWAATAALPEMKDARPEELGRSAILAYDLKSRALKRRYELPADGRKHVIGEVLVGRDGRIFATDSASGDLYALDPDSGRFEALAAPGALSSPQGLAQGRSRRELYVADYTRGLFRFDVEKRELTRLDVARDISVYGIDGLSRIGDDLVAVQNGIRPHRIVHLELERSGRRVRHASVLAASLAEFDEPTLGVVVGRRFHFVANSQWNRFGKDHRLPPATELKGPVVLSVSLERRRDRRSQPGSRQSVPAEPAPPLPLPPVDLPGL